MLASTVKSRPRYFFIVFALAGDSTITRLVEPLAIGASLLEERVEAAREVVARLLLLEAAALPVFVLARLLAPVAALLLALPVVFFVVAIYSFFRSSDFANLSRFLRTR